MNVQDKINDIIVKHNAIIKANPSINEITWVIEDAPYKVMEDLKNKHTTETHPLSLNPFADKVFLNLHPWQTMVEKLLITIWSTPIKVKTTIEVIEEEPATL